MVAYWRVGEVSMGSRREMWMMMSGRVMMCWVMPVTVPSYGIKPSLRHIVMSFVMPVKPRVIRRQVGAAPVMRHVRGGGVGEVRGGSSGRQ